MDRPHVDDATALSVSVHALQARARGQERAVQVDGEHLLPFFERKLVDGLDHLDAGVADEYVDTSERRHRLFDSRLDLRLVRHVYRNTYGLATAPRKLFRGRFGGLFIEAGNRHLGALAREYRRYFLADTAFGAGDECNLVLETHGLLLTGCQIVVHDGAQIQRQIAHEVQCRDHSAHREVRDRRQRMRMQFGGV